MIQLGAFNKLIVVESMPKGYYLAEHPEAKDKALLLAHEVEDVLELGSKVKVFIFNDPKGRKRATLKIPKITLEQLAPLKVVSINHIGAFLDWGLEKDLFMPFNEQIGRIHKGETHLVGMYIDKSGRLCATMKIYERLSCSSPYEVNSIASGTIYSIKEAYGAFVAVDNRYHGLIPIKEMYGDYQVGSAVEVRVKKVREDGKLELSLRKTTHLQMEDDARKIMDVLEELSGFLALNDKSSPEDIKARLQMSKAAFKRAVGRLLKEGAIEITDKGISRNW